MKEERKLTEKESARKEKFDVLCAEMQQKGYTIRLLTVGILQANIIALVIMLPFVALFAWIYFAANCSTDISLVNLILALPIFLGLVVLHELIHGLTWGIFTESHFKVIDFGVIWSMLTPYCTCSEPMKKWQYLLGCAMPTLILGFGLAVVSIISDSFFLFLLSEVMIVSGGADFFVVLKILVYRADGKAAVYYDHPYECGVVVFEK